MRKRRTVVATLALLFAPAMGAAQDYAKGEKPPLSYASSGAGGAQHLSMEIFRKKAGFEAGATAQN